MTSNSNAGPALSLPVGSGGPRAGSPCAGLSCSQSAIVQGGLWETNARDFKINGELFLSVEGLKYLCFPSRKTNLNGSLSSRERLHLSQESSSPGRLLKGCSLNPRLPGPTWPSQDGVFQAWSRIYVWCELQALELCSYQ